MRRLYRPCTRPRPRPRTRRTWRHRGGHRRLLALLVALAAVATGIGLVGSVPASAQPWDCPAQPGATTGYVFRNGQALRIDPATGTITDTRTIQGSVDGVGFNTIDGYFYGVSGTQVVKIEANGSLVPVGPSLPFSTGPTGTLNGDFDDKGHLWLMNDQGQWAEIDLDPRRPGSYGTVVSQGSTPIPSQVEYRSGDWTYVSNGPAGAGFYGVGERRYSVIITISYEPHLLYFNPVSRTTTDLGVANGMPNVTTSAQRIQYRATFTDGQGNLYVSGHYANRIYRLNLSSRSATELQASVPGAEILDGAQCRRLGQATVRLVKQVQGRNVPMDEFVVRLRDDYGGTVGEVATSGGADNAESPPFAVGPGTDYWLSDRLLQDQLPPDGRYEVTADCRNSFGQPVPLQPYAPGDWRLTVPYVDAFVCTVRNRAAGQLEAFLSKYPEPQVVARAGEVVHYRFKLSNFGQTAITRFDGFDPGLGRPLNCPLPPGGLLPGDSVECLTIPRTVTQEDIDRGEPLWNTAHAHVEDILGQGQPVAADSAVMVHNAPPGISLTKSAAPSPVTHAGQQLTYRYHVTNTGATTLHDVDVRDIVVGGTGGSPVVDCRQNTLAPEQSMDCTGVYTVTQEDIDRHPFVENQASVTAVNQQGSVAGPAADGVAVPVERHPALELAKTAVPQRVDHAGQLVTYTFTLHNSGNTTLENLQVHDTALIGRGRLGPLDCGVTVLAPGQRVECTAHYTVSQADIDAGGIDNTASATGLVVGSGDAVTTPEVSVHVAADRRPGLSLVKTAELRGSYEAGQEVAYSYRVTNSGNTTITEVAAADTEFSGHGPRPDVDCPARTLRPDESTLCTATYRLVQADIDQGAVTNTAHANGNGPQDTAVTSNEYAAAVTGPRVAGLDLVKQADPTTVDRAGRRITYTFTATNSGTVTLSEVTLVENRFTGTGGPLDIACGSATLAPGASTRCTASYEVTQEDIDAGRIDNTATAIGSSPAGSAPVVSAAATARVVSRAESTLRLVKTATPDTVGAAGESVEYTYAVTNTGQVTVRELGIEDSRFDAPGPNCPPEPVEPGRTVLCTASYTPGAQDVEAGSFTNTATAYAARVDNGHVVSSDEARAEVKVAPSSVKFTKRVAPKEVTGAGDEVIYSFEVTNTGQTILSQPAIQESQFTGSNGPLDIACPAVELAPGSSATCTAAYTVTAADIAAGGIDNSAVATAVGPRGTVTSPAAGAHVSSAEPPEPPKNSLKLKKTAKVRDTNGNRRTDPGDIITWQITATNTGEQPLTNLTVSDPTAGRVTCPDTTLEPGASTTCTTAPYRITKKDARRGEVTDTATASATTPDGHKIASAPAHAAVVVQGNGGPGHGNRPGHGDRPGHHKPRPPAGPGKPGKPGGPGK